MNLEQAFGSVLQELRNENSLSQERLAEKCGLHRTYISLLERGLKNPTLTTLFRLSSHLSISPHEFVQRVDLKLKSENAKGIE